MSTRVFLVVLVATSASQVSGVAGGGLAWASDTTGIQYVIIYDDGSEVVVPPIRNVPGVSRLPHRLIHRSLLACHREG